MAKVDPAQLEREAEELQRKLMGTDPETDTPDPQTKPPSPQEDTGEHRQEATGDEQDRGDPETPVDEERDIAVLRERYKNAQAAVTRATQEAAELRRQNAALQQQLSDRTQAEGAQTQPTIGDDPEGTFAKLVEEFPEIMKPIIARFARLEAQAQTIVQRDAAKAEQDATEAHLNAIRERHPDLDEIAGTADFEGWVARQSPMKQRIAEQGNAAEVVELLDAYKADMGMTDRAPQRETAMDRARKVAEPTLPKHRRPDPNANKKIWTRSDIARLSLEDYEKHRDDIDRAYVEGRVR